MDQSSREEPWEMYRLLVMTGLERLNDSIGLINVKVDLVKDDINNKIQSMVTSEIAKLQVEVAMLKVKAGMAGAIAGLVVGGVMSLIVAMLMRGSVVK